MEEWNIQQRAPVCAQCRKVFEEKEECFTVLSHAGEEFRREDFCLECWNASGGSVVGEKAGVISHWQGVYELPAPPPVDPLPKEDAESILRRMLERNDPSEKEARYILMVMLERKRIFKQRGSQPGEESMLVYEHTKTGEVFLIADPKFRLDQLGEVQKRVAVMLKSAPTADSAAAAPVEG